MANTLKPFTRCLLTNLETAPITLMSPWISRSCGPHCPAKTCQVNRPELQQFLVRNYAKGARDVCDGCRRAFKDIPKPVDPDCPLPCERKKPKKKGLLYKMKLRIIEGGTNFGTPFRRIKCKLQSKKDKPQKKEEEPAKLPAPKIQTNLPIERRPGCQVSILGADTAVGQYIALLLKQCPQIKKLRLYQAGTKDKESTETDVTNPNRDMFNVAQDLLHIDTNCTVQAFSSSCKLDLELCLQNTDIVLILDSPYANVNMPFDKRFESQAPQVKRYAECIAHECPKAMVIVCATPVDCMVPLIAETMNETGWYDKRKLLGSMAVPEMRASTLAARALSLEPVCTRVPCVGGTEGLALVPLFSKTVSYFEFARHNAELLTETVRRGPWTANMSDECCAKSASLSEAHAVARLVKNVAHARLCHDVTKVSGFVETDASQIISPARYLGLAMLLDNHGICHKYDLPPLNKYELNLMDNAWKHIKKSVDMANKWYMTQRAKDPLITESKSQKIFYCDRRYTHIDDCLSMAQ